MTAYCGLNGVLIIEVPLYRTVYCGLSGVLILEVSLYRTAWYSPNGVLIIEVYSLIQFVTLPSHWIWDPHLYQHWLMGLPLPRNHACTNMCTYVHSIFFYEIVYTVSTILSVVVFLYS